MTGQTSLHQQTDTSGLQFPLWIQIAQDSALCLRPYQVQDIDQAFRRLDKLEDLYLISTDALLSANEALEAQAVYSDGLEEQLGEVNRSLKKKKRNLFFTGLSVGVITGVLSISLKK